MAARVDWRSCLDLGTNTGKLPLRWALSQHISRQTQAKRGFVIPMASWLRGPLRDVYREKVVGRTELAGVALDSGAAERLLAAHMNGHDFSRSLWTLLSLALWEDRHFRPAVQRQGYELPAIVSSGASV